MRVKIACSAIALSFLTTAANASPVVPTSGIYLATEVENCNNGLTYQVVYPGPGLPGELWYAQFPGSQEITVAHYPITPKAGVTTQSGAAFWVSEPSGKKSNPTTFSRTFVYIDQSSYMLHLTHSTGCDVWMTLVGMEK